MDATAFNSSAALKFILRLSITVILVLSLAIPLNSSQALPNPPGLSFTVNSNSDLGDNNPGDASCTTSEGTCSLRAAIEEMNSNNSSGTISFNGDYTIYLIGSIPVTTSNVTITGGDHNINIVGPSSGSIFYLRSNGNQIDHLTMTNPNGYGIYIQDDQATDPTRLGSNNVIDHVTFINSYTGVMIMGNAADGTTANHNTIQNSLFGTTEVSPTSCDTNEGNRFGIQLYFSNNTTILDNQIVCSIDNIDYSADGLRDFYGYNLTISGNTISGNEEYGIYTEQTDTGAITGNTIGNQGGTVAFPNGSDGIRLTYNSNNITIGGSNPSDTNIISGNTGVGIYLDGYSSPINNVTIDGNLIGLNVGHEPMPNAKGIVTFMSNHITIGSNDHSLVQQFVAGNIEDGITIINSDHIDIKDSTLIGIANWTNDTAPDFPAGNGWNGVRLVSATYVNIDSWKIAYNSWYGILLQTDNDLHNRLLPKNIYANGYIPIDLGDNGFTVNDEEDADSGANELLNYPIIVDVHGNELEGDACALCTVYFYLAVGNPGVNGGGGRTSLGMAPAAVDADGHWSATLPAGVHPINVTMLTYDSSSNQTSEFSPVVFSSFLPLLVKP